MSSTLELWQTEWCPSSHRVRQRMTELGIGYSIRQVPVEHDDRLELVAATGVTEIPVLVSDGEVIAGEDTIFEYLDRNFPEPREADAQRRKAAKAKKRELEDACPKLTAATH